MFRYTEHCVAEPSPARPSRLRRLLASLVPSSYSMTKRGIQAVGGDSVETAGGTGAIGSLQASGALDAQGSAYGRGGSPRCPGATEPLSRASRPSNAPRAVRATFQPQPTADRSAFSPRPPHNVLASPVAPPSVTTHHQLMTARAWRFAPLKATAQGALVQSRTRRFVAQTTFESSLGGRPYAGMVSPTRAFIRRHPVDESRGRKEESSHRFKGADWKPTNPLSADVHSRYQRRTAFQCRN
jgi:hypothetical protein